MFKEIILFGKVISPYSILAIIGSFAAGIYACKKAKKFTGDDSDMLTLVLISAIGVIFGGRILYGITNYKTVLTLFSDLSVIKSFKDFEDYAVMIFGGAVYYGGLIGGMVVGFIYMKKKRYDIDLSTDIAAPAIPLLHFFGRIGCFLVGCCYGLECKIGVTYQHSLIASANGVNRFPIQLVEAVFNLCLFFVLDYLLRHEKLKGKLIYIYLIAYPIARFIIEFFRGDEYRGFLFGLSTSQIISIGFLIFATAMLIKKSKVPSAISSHSKV